MLIALIGRSGSGKTTIQNHLKKEYNIKPIIKYYTRPIRENEINHVSYHFVSKLFYNFKFLTRQFITSQNFKTVYGIWKCGISREDFNNAIKDSQIYSIVLTPYEAKKLFPKYITMRTFYIKVNEEILKERAFGRNDNTVDNEKLRRFMADKKDFENIDAYVDMTINNNGEYNIDEISKIIFGLI